MPLYLLMQPMRLIKPSNSFALEKGGNQQQKTELVFCQGRGHITHRVVFPVG